MELIDTTATVHTPERVRFRYRLAGPAQRGVAWLIDVTVMAILLFAFLIVGVFLDLTVTEGTGTGAFRLAVFGVQWLYGATCETLMSGQTPGKMVMSLRVVRTDGSPAQLPDFLLRNLLRVADALPTVFLAFPTFGLGVIVMAFSPRHRRIGDLVAGTVVVVEDEAFVLGSVNVEPPVTEEERQALPPSVHLTNQELQVIEAFLRRRPRLSNERAEDLAKLFAPTVTDRTGVEASSAERVLALAYARATGRDRDVFHPDSSP